MLLSAWDQTGESERCRFARWRNEKDGGLEAEVDARDGETKTEETWIHKIHEEII